MYIAVSQHGIKPTIEVNYRQDFDTYILKLSDYTHVGMNQKEVETLYDEILSAIMHKHYSVKKEVESEWEN